MRGVQWSVAPNSLALMVPDAQNEGESSACIRRARHACFSGWHSGE